MFRMAQMISPVLDTEVLLAALEAFEHGAHHFVPMEFPGRMEDRRETRLDVHHTVFMHLLHHFVGDAFEALLRLHHTTRVREPFQIHRQTAPLSAAVKPLGQLACVCCRKRFVVLVSGQLDRRLGSQAAIEMVVQEDLRQRADERIG